MPYKRKGDYVPKCPHESWSLHLPLDLRLVARRCTAPHNQFRQGLRRSVGEADVGLKLRLARLIIRWFDIDHALLTCRCGHDCALLWWVRPMRRPPERRWTLPIPRHQGTPRHILVTSLYEPFLEVNTQCAAGEASHGPGSRFSPAPRSGGAGVPKSAQPAGRPKIVKMAAKVRCGEI